MRRQIVSEFHALRDTTERLDERTAELERSNTELEQFAYVASHDLQEPLRKVASFTQLLERRYKGQLDERADQYIAFAVDGAKRMQVLINDLLAFSRVGRLTREHVEIGAGELVDQALANLSLAIEESGATVTVAEDMPPGVGRRVAAGRRLPEPHRQRAQVPRRAAAAASRCPGPTPATSGSSPSPTTGSGSSPSTPTGSS